MNYITPIISKEMFEYYNSSKYLIDHDDNLKLLTSFIDNIDNTNCDNNIGINIELTKIFNKPYYAQLLGLKTFSLDWYCPNRYNNYKIELRIDRRIIISNIFDISKISANDFSEVIMNFINIFHESIIKYKMDYILTE